MNKEEILEKSRKEKNDEVAKNIDRTGHYYGLFLGDIILVIAYWFSNNASIGSLFDSILGAQLFGQFGYLFLKQRSVVYALLSFLGLLLSVYGMLLFFNVI